VRQHIPSGRQGVIRPPEELSEAPAWFTSRAEENA
jgi:hypothetical protein